MSITTNVIPPMKNNQIDPKGLKNPSATWYIFNGASGHYHGINNLTDFTNGLVYGLDGVYGWSHFTVHNSIHLAHKFIASRNDSVMDSATLYKMHNYSSCTISRNLILLLLLFTKQTLSQVFLFHSLWLPLLGVVSALLI